MNMRVLALASYPERMAATRFRVLAYLPYLERAGIRVDFISMLDDGAAMKLYSPGGGWRTVGRMVHGIGRQLQATLKRYDAVFIQREACLFGPPVIEGVLSLLRGIPVVYDFDDAVWLPGGTDILRRVLKMPGKTRWLMRRAQTVIAGSRHLADEARRWNRDVHVLPTVVSREQWQPAPCRYEGAFHDLTRPPVIGWVGTHSTAEQLTLVAPALRRLRDEGYCFELRVVGAAPDFELRGLPLVRREWAMDGEVDLFRELDIGLAPMRDGAWHQGKCGFKQLQYMAVGVPHISSWVGGARDVLVDGRNALIARSDHDWYESLKTLLNDAGVRARLAREGRRDVELRYSTEVQGPLVAKILADSVALH